MIMRRSSRKMEKKKRNRRERTITLFKYECFS
jgi:hypothetical protein